jgi:glycosyltransferase involved in cell wall biosynthesis
MKVAIVIPSYNEELTIQQVIRDFSRAMPSAELIVVNNNSVDRTEALARESLREVPNPGRIINESRQGKANAIRAAFNSVDADIYVMVDADMTYPAEEINKLIEPVRAGVADMVVGDRLFGGIYRQENKRRFHNFGNLLVKGCINWLFESNFNDIMSGYRAFNRKFVKNFPIMCEGFELETEMTLHALDKRFKMIEVPITYKDRPAGSFSKLNTFSDGLFVLLTIFHIFRHYKPITFFIAFSAFFAVLGLLIGIPVVIEFVETSFINKIPSAILASSLMVFSVILFCVGLILDTVVVIHRSEFEKQLMCYSDSLPGNVEPGARR